MDSMRLPRTICWVGGLDGAVELIDQTLLPTEVKYLVCRDVETLREAIMNLRVRGATGNRRRSRYGCGAGCPGGGEPRIVL